jgi:hypothetical protein
LGLPGNIDPQESCIFPGAGILFLVSVYIYIGIGIYVIYIYSTMQQIEAQAKSILRGSEVLHSQMRIHLLTGYDSVQGVKS